MGIENVRTKYLYIGQNLVFISYFLNPLSAGVAVTQTDRQRERETCIQTNTQTNKQTDGQTYRETDRQTDRKT